MKYKIIEDEYCTKVESEVERLQAEGWELHGVAFTRVNMVCQAMVKEDKPEPDGLGGFVVPEKFQDSLKDMLEKSQGRPDIDQSKCNMCGKEWDKIEFKIVTHDQKFLCGSCHKIHKERMEADIAPINTDVLKVTQGGKFFIKMSPGNQYKIKGIANIPLTDKPESVAKEILNSDEMFVGGLICMVKECSGEIDSLFIHNEHERLIADQVFCSAKCCDKFYAKNESVARLASLDNSLSWHCTLCTRIHSSKNWWNDGKRLLTLFCTEKGCDEYYLKTRIQENAKRMVDKVESVAKEICGIEKGLADFNTNCNRCQKRYASSRAWFHEETLDYKYGALFCSAKCCDKFYLEKKDD